MANDDIEALRARLARLTGPARTRTLLDLGQRLADRYWRAGPGSPAGLPYLDEAAAVLEEAYGYFEPGAVTRGQVAGMLGWLVGTRYVAHGSPDTDRETGIRMLEESLAFPQLPAVQQIIVRMVLGQLLLGRLTRAMQARGTLIKAMQSGTPLAENADAVRAADCFRQVVQDPSAGAEIVSVAEPMLALAEAVQAMAGAVGQGAGGLDLAKVQDALSAIQAVQQQAGAARGRGAGLSPIPGIFQAETIAGAHPLDRPIAVMDGPAPAMTPVPSPRRRAAPATDAAALRMALRERLPGTGPRPFASVLALLQTGATTPDVGTVDELVALATSLVAAPGSGPDDRLLHAAALYLRSLMDSGGWVHGDGDGDDDRRAAAASLMAAVGALPAKRADVVAVAFRLATLLDEKSPSGELRKKLGDGFAKVAEALRTAGADVLAYPQPGGLLLLVASTGRFELAAPGVRLPPRVLMAGDGPVPDESVVSYVRTGSQVVDLAARPRPATAETPVFVVNPRGDREQATTDAVVLRRAFYPRSIGLGLVGEHAHGAGTVDELRAHLRASMLHLDCGITAGGELELAKGARLGLRQISAVDGRLGKAGGLAILPPVARGAAVLTDALLAANFANVVGWRSAVPRHIASLASYLLHRNLVDERRDVPSAVKAVQRWMRDPHRKPPPDLPAAYERAAGSAELTDAACWAAMVQHGVR